METKVTIYLYYLRIYCSIGWRTAYTNRLSNQLAVNMRQTERCHYAML
jgi:hypothetical protein